LKRKPGCRSLIWIFTAVLVFPFASFLPAQSVRFVRSIDLNGKTGGKNIKTFLLGKKAKKGFNPFSICRLGENRLCVTDTVNGAVIIMDNRGKIKKMVTHVKGIKIISPVCACTDDQGNLYVSDSAREVVLKFDRKYKFKGVFISAARVPDRDEAKPGTPGDSDNSIRITGMVFSRGTLYAVDTANHRVPGFNLQGELTLSFGRRGTAPGEFNFPTHITADDRYIYVTDAMNFRVQVFDHSGTFIRMFGSQGRGGGNFAKPKGIAVDREKHIFVADAMFDNVQIFDIQGRFLYYFGAPGHRESEFWMPSGIMVDHDNTIWVADTYNNRIQVFKLVENTP
jgi:DNA-binding beta-propeller fold protein YncE